MREPTRAQSLTPDAYLRKQMYRVPGFMRNPDGAVIASMLAWQQQTGVRGNLCEIGVHHGRLFLMLALSRREDERSLAIDLFEDDDINRGIQAGRNGAMVRHAKRLGIELSSDEILKGSSMDVTAEEILRRTGGPIRFFSVDGGHLYEHVENDLRLAAKCLAPEGILAADDFFYLGWPEVSAAVFDFLRATPEFVPVCATNRKLFLARRDFAPKLLEFVRSSPPRGVQVSFPTRLFGNQIALQKISLFARGVEELHARMGR